jgi:hypothetical protein
MISNAKLVFDINKVNQGITMGTNGGTARLKTFRMMEETFTQKSSVVLFL